MFSFKEMKQIAKDKRPLCWRCGQPMKYVEVEPSNYIKVFPAHEWHCDCWIKELNEIDKSH